MRGASQADAFGSLQKAVVKERGAKKWCDLGAGRGSPLCCSVTRPRSITGGLAAPHPLLPIQPKRPQVKNTDLSSEGRRVFQTRGKLMSMGRCFQPHPAPVTASHLVPCGVRFAALCRLGWRCWRRVHLIRMAKHPLPLRVRRSQRPQTPVGGREGMSQDSTLSDLVFNGLNGNLDWQRQIWM